jgi:hypothetical protein
MDAHTPDIAQVRRLLEEAAALGLSVRACERLGWLEHLCETGSVTDTTRHFGIPRMALYRVLRRFNPADSKSLEDQSRRPHTMRRPAARVPAIESDVPQFAQVAEPVAMQPAAQPFVCQCALCRIRAWPHLPRFKSGLVLASVLVNVAFVSFLLATAVLEGRSFEASLASDSASASDSAHLHSLPLE